MATYCTSADVQAIISIEAALSFSDDNESGDNSATELTYITFCIERAASVIDAYLVKRYALDDLTSSTFLKFCNAIMAAKYLTTRRLEGVATSIMEDYDEFIGLLKDIGQGLKDIPDVIDSFNHLPTVTNYWVQFTKGVTPVRVVDSESTGEEDWQGQLKRRTDTFHWRNAT